MNIEKATEEQQSIDDILDSIKATILDQSNKPADKKISAEASDESEELTLTEVVGNFDEDEPQIEITSNAENESTNNPEAIISTATREHTEALLKDFAETAESLGQKINSQDIDINSKQDKTVEKFVLELLEPQMKSWLNENLPKIVKEVVSEEVKKLVANMNNKK